MAWASQPGADRGAAPSPGGAVGEAAWGPDPSGARSRRRTRPRRPARGAGMGSHQSSQVCRVVSGLSTPSPFNANYGTERRGKAPGNGFSRVMESPPRAPRSTQEVRCRPGRSRSPSVAGARRVNGNGGSPRRARRGAVPLSGAGRGGSPSRARAGLRKPGREPHRRAGRARVNPSGPGGAGQAQNPRI